MDSQDRKTIGVMTAGLTSGREDMLFHFDICQCGPITDGIAIQLPDSVLSGPWVIPFSGLEAVYHAAVAVRSEKREAANRKSRKRGRR